MFGKKARVVGQTVLFACVVRTWRKLISQVWRLPDTEVELRCRHVAGRAKDRTGARNIAECMANDVGNLFPAFFVCGFTHRSGQRRQVAAGLLKTLGGFTGRFGVSHDFSSVVQSKCHRIHLAILATERNTFPASSTLSIKRRRSFASKGRLRLLAPDFR